MAHRPPGAFATVGPLLELCLRGKLYEIENWIAEDRPIQFPPDDDKKLRRRPTALQIAIKRGNHSLVALLLANGYNPNGDYYECLSPAVDAKDRDMVDLLLRFGADPKAVDFCRVLETCDRELMDRFIQSGIDPCQDNAVARALDSNRRPIFGFIKQYRENVPCLQRQIDIALHVSTDAGQMRGIALLLWVGANPHAETPSSAYEDFRDDALHRTAFETALWSPKKEIVDLFLKKPIPAEKRQELIASAAYQCQPELVRRLLKEGVDVNASGDEGYPLLHGFIHALLWRYRSPSPDEVARGFEALKLVLKAGAKWPLDECQLKGLRRDLADGESKVVVQLLDLLHQHQAISAEQLIELTRTPAVQKVLNGTSKPRRDLFGSYVSPVPIVIPTAPAPKRGYWKRHWSQR